MCVYVRVRVYACLCLSREKEKSVLSGRVIEAAMLYREREDEGKQELAEDAKWREEGGKGREKGPESEREKGEMRLPWAPPDIPPFFSVRFRPGGVCALSSARFL